MPSELVKGVGTVAEVIVEAIGAALVIAVVVLVVSSNSMHTVPFWPSPTIPSHALIVSI